MILPREVIHDMIYYGIPPPEEQSFQTVNFISPTGRLVKRPLNDQTRRIIEKQV